MLLAIDTPASNVRETLQSTAEDLGATGWDEYYGWGLVDAGKIVGVQAAPRRYMVSPAGKLPVTWGEIKAK